MRLTTFDRFIHYNDMFLKSIRAKILFTLAFLTGLSFVLIVCLTFYFNLQKNRLTFFYSQVNLLLNEHLLLDKIEKDFLADDLINTEFFRTKDSQILRHQAQQSALLLEHIKQIQADETATSMGIEMENHLTEAGLRLQAHTIAFEGLKQLVLQRGFKDYGMEGKMRNYVHLIEDSKELKTQNALLLSVRRQEKDFIIRKEKKYIDKLKQEWQILYNYASASQASPTLLRAINEYKDTFLQFAALEEQIGFDNHKGVKGEVFAGSDNLEKLLVAIQTKALAKSQDFEQDYLAYCIFAGVFLVLLVAMISYQTARYITKPIDLLSDNILESVKSNFSNDIEPIQNNSVDEVGSLTRNFNQLVAQIKADMIELRQNAERLEASSTAERERNWQVEGQQLLGNELERATDSTNLDQVLACLCRHSSLQLGAIYMQDPNLDSLCLEGKYGIAAPQHLPITNLYAKVLDKGEQVILYNLPANYYKINSGLGSCSPAMAILIPIKYENTTIGVLEIAAINPLNELTIRFMTQAARRIGQSLKQKQRAMGILADY